MLQSIKTFEKFSCEVLFIIQNVQILYRKDNAYEKENEILGEYSNKIDETVDGTRQDDNILKIFSKVEGTEEIQKFEYTGDYQEFTAQQDGYYKIECWGAGGYKDSGYAGRKTEKVHILQVLYI